MADKAQQPKEIEEVEKTKAEEKPVEDGKVENGDEKASENGDSKEDTKETVEDEADEKSEEKSTLKRKSTGGGDATDNVAPAEGVTPEKKVKTTETTETEAKDAKAAA